MKRRMLVGTLAATLLVLATAGPAAAAVEGGRRHYDFPKHNCAGAVPTHVDLYLRASGGLLDGRIRYFSGTCSAAANSIHIYTIILWQYRGSGNWRNVALVGAPMTWT